MSLYTLPLNVLIQIFTYSTKRDRNKHLALVCHRFWMIRKKHFVNVAFHSDLLKCKQEKVHLRAPEFLLILNVMKQPSCSSTAENNKCIVKSIAEFCKKFGRKKVTILVKTPSFLHYQKNCYYSENHSPKIKAKIAALICKLKHEFDTPGADSRFVRKFAQKDEYFYHEVRNVSFYQGISFNTCNL